MLKMKQVLIGTFVLIGFALNAQNDLHAKLVSFISNQTKEKAENRLIAIHVWTVNDPASRKVNAEFDHAYHTFDHAKLKGGKEGIIVLDINFENDEVNADITLQKDGVTKSIKVPSHNSEIVAALKGKPSGYNVVYDHKGNIVYENLTEGHVFENIQKLITR